MAERSTGTSVPTVIADEPHIVYRVNGAKSGKGSATAALSRIVRRGEKGACARCTRSDFIGDCPTEEVLNEYEKFTGK